MKCCPEIWHKTRDMTVPFLKKCIFKTIEVTFIVLLWAHFVNMFYICRNSVYYRTDRGMRLLRKRS